MLFRSNRLVSILLKIFASMFIMDIGLKFSFLVESLPGFGIRMMLRGVTLPAVGYGVLTLSQGYTASSRSIRGCTPGGWQRK